LGVAPYSHFDTLCAACSVVEGHRKTGNIYYCVKAQMTVAGKAPEENYRIKIEGLKSHLIVTVG